MRALFLIWRMFVLAWIAYGLCHSPSLGVSLFMLFAGVYFACDTVSVLVAARRW